MRRPDGRRGRRERGEPERYGSRENSARRTARRRSTSWPTSCARSARVAASSTSNAPRQGVEHREQADPGARRRRGSAAPPSTGPVRPAIAPLVRGSACTSSTVQPSDAVDEQRPRRERDELGAVRLRHERGRLLPRVAEHHERRRHLQQPGGDARDAGELAVRRHVRDHRRGRGRRRRPACTGAAVARDLLRERPLELRTRLLERRGGRRASDGSCPISTAASRGGIAVGDLRVAASAARTRTR